MKLMWVWWRPARVGPDPELNFDWRDLADQTENEKHQNWASVHVHLLQRADHKDFLSSGQEMKSKFKLVENHKIHKSV